MSIPLEFYLPISTVFSGRKPMRGLAVVLFRVGGLMIMHAALGGAARFMYRGIAMAAGAATDAAQWAWYLQVPVIILVALIGMLLAGSGIALVKLAPPSISSPRSRFHSR